VKNTYKVEVNESSTFELNSDDKKLLDAVKSDKYVYHILHKNKAFQANIIQSDFLNREYTVKINANKYKIKILDSLDMLIEKLGLAESSGNEGNEIIAPIPGVITEICVKEGDLIKKGDPLLVLEAMKMENTIASHRDSTIGRITVEAGNVVEKGKLLIEFV